MPTSSLSITPALALRDGLALAGLVLLAAALIAVNPIGYIGGHWDDGRYLAAAQSWAAHGPQLGHDHWSLRWPVLVPAILVIKLFGATRTSLMLPGLAAFAALLLLHFSAARRAFGLDVAVLAAIALVTTPELLVAATRLTADLPEALFWSAALWALWFAGDARQGRRNWLVTAGIAAALAWATRETALGLLGLIALACATRWRGIDRAAWGWVALGFAALALPEMIALGWASGDPLYRFHIDINHVHIASHNLAGAIDPATRVLGDPELMARWRGSGPVRLHWAIDPWINLFANPGYGLGFVAAAVAVAAARRTTILTPAIKRLVAVLGGAAAVQIGAVIYIIATDPKPRMFLPAVVLATMVFGLAGAALRASGKGRATVATLIAAKLAMTFVFIDLATSYADVPAKAAAALAVATGPVDADRWTRSELALAPAVSARLGTAPGAEMLAIGKPGDRDGGGCPPAGQWTIAWRSAPGREPLVAHWLAHLGMPAESAFARDLRNRTPVVTLYRRD